MKKVFLTLLLILTLTILITLPAFSQTPTSETLTFTTYYPSPHGVYKQLLVTERMAIGNADGSIDGIVDVNDLGADALGNPAISSITLGGSLALGTHIPSAVGNSITIVPTGVYDSRGDYYLAEALRVVGPTSDYIIAIQDGTGRVQHYWNAMPGSANQTYLVSGEAAGKILFGAPNNTYPWIEFKYGPSGGAAIAGAPISWESHMVIKQDGNVGIGTDNPQAKLDITAAPTWSVDNYGANLVVRTGNGVQRNNAIALLDALDSNPWAIANKDGNLRIMPMPALGTNNTSPTYDKGLHITANGNVGIGTVNPTAKLHVKGASPDNIQKWGYGADTYMTLGRGYASSNGSLVIGSDGSDILYPMPLTIDMRGQNAVEGRNAIVMYASDDNNMAVILSNKSTIGFWQLPPPIGPDKGANLSHAKLPANIQVGAVTTGDIHFEKDGKKLWRMFEDEEGVYLENIRSGKVYSFVLQELK